MPEITESLTIPDGEIEISAIRSQGAGGQNVNKVSTAIHLRFDINASSLPERYKERLLSLTDHRITKEGILNIKSQESRSQEENKEAALERLRELIKSVMATQKKRKATKPTRNSQKRRLDSKTKHGNIKQMRGRVDKGEG
ncbi:MAG: aminoacyl-tRNA hydrolase [Sulfuricurvum sp.]|jgi:ribosome-associated protein|uniref:alternative ribosome rescue aminoacyl-tRNA hydrolase ArfB n=1 Tax=Sulfuricurvum sp. TaxID=2025608 RepID=UPI0025FAFFDF|nr:alternative ribosome rescue aminoacyl-tRNA hydrolase ArfB [Sulfuricurvum sp.]MCK9373270.1 aminoacyl-tRNA hydrolase [Sulfuricurvum sp.]